ncbi:37507_t:CDS:1, partial [Gigaspora margarita]
MKKKKERGSKTIPQHSHGSKINELTQFRGAQYLEREDVTENFVRYRNFIDLPPHE